MFRSMPKYVATLLAVVLMPLVGARAQELLWNASFDFRFDNREYGDPSLMIAPSETIFGATLLPQVGMGWGVGHSLMAGALLPADMGSPNFMGAPEWMAYYNYDGDNFKVYTGIFPRSAMRGDYSLAMFSEQVRFQDKVIEGALAQWVTSDWYTEFGCDWMGLPTENQRERFMLFCAGRAWKGFSYAGYAATLFHHAGSKSLGGVVDNALAEVYLGLDLQNILPFDRTYVEVGWLQGYQNDRKYGDGPKLPGGWQLEIGWEHEDLGVCNTFYKGGNLMPFYDSPYEDKNGAPYADQLYFGDTFYRTGPEGVYNRLELYYAPRLRGGVQLRMSSVHHYDGVRWGWQQVIALSIDIGQGMF